MIEVLNSHGTSLRKQEIINKENMLLASYLHTDSNIKKIIDKGGSHKK